MTRPVIYDLYSGAGGAAMGYHRAGFDVIGFDLEPQPRYPFRFIQADALEVLAALIDKGLELWPDLPPCDALHLSPVCKRFSTATPKEAKAAHPNHIPAARILAGLTGRPFIIENVPGAPLRPDLIVCGCVVGLPELERERWFELSWQPAPPLRPPCNHQVQPVTVAGHGEPSGPRAARAQRVQVISVVGGGPDYGPGKAHRAFGVADWRRAMGIDWMTRDELAQAVPPRFTEYVAGFLLERMAQCTR